MAHVSKKPDLVISEAQVVTKATVVAADRLGLSTRTLADIVGVSEESVSRMKRLDHLLEKGTKPFELALLLLRLFRALDAITGGNERVARAWLKNHNTALAAIPADKILTVSGLTDVLAYLDTRRALV
ncbi:MbcA/ParS/Xre antitoxin family protein [Aliirhizobium smilacinae]|nr:MbcA/ParS/Xre antitoxin family protein [Rhizobium smilacinae]